MKWRIKILEQLHTNRDENFYAIFHPETSSGQVVANRNNKKYHYCPTKNYKFQ